MSLEIKNVGTIDTVDEIEKDRLWISIDAAPKTSTVFLTFGKRHGGDLEIALDVEAIQQLLSLLEQAVSLARKPRA